MQRLGTILKQTVRPITDDDRFSLTPKGYAALAASEPTTPEAKPEDAKAAKGCPRCGAVLAAINLYHGGRGYVSYDSCTACDYRRRAR